MNDMENAVDEAVEIYEIVEKHPAMNRISLKNKRLPKPPEPKPKFGKLKKNQVILLFLLFMTRSTRVAAAKKRLKIPVFYPLSPGVRSGELRLH